MIKQRPSIYTCSACRCEFESEWSDEEADAEARRLFGVGSDSPSMRVVCDDCFKAMANHFGWQQTPEELK